MTKINWPSQLQQSSFLNASLETIGRNVDFYYTVATSGCSSCSLDPVSNTSTDAFCTVCSGSYWLDTFGVYSTNAHVTWKYSEDTTWYSAGQQVKGDCQLRINFDSAIYDIINKVSYILVDGRVMQVDKINLRGSPEVNRIILTLMEKENGS